MSQVTLSSIFVLYLVRGLYLKKTKKYMIRRKRYKKVLFFLLANYDDDDEDGFLCQEDMMMLCVMCVMYSLRSIILLAHSLTQFGASLILLTLQQSTEFLAPTTT